jgi:hypothetical protein
MAVTREGERENGTQAYAQQIETVTAFRTTKDVGIDELLHRRPVRPHHVFVAGGTLWHGLENR